MTRDLTQFVKRVFSFPRKSSRQMFESYVYRWIRWFPGIPAPMRHPTGAWWLLDKDFIGESILRGGYETAESEFAARFLKPGMTVLDIGAHRGFHTLLFSKKVGKHGHVLSFEPSARDRKRLQLHLIINFCRNVEVVACALGDEDTETKLYAVAANSVLNSLRPPDTQLETSTTPVALRKLDNLLSAAKIDSVDFIKIDVEGGELGVLRGAERLLARSPRPVILCEVLEQRTRPWGYTGRLLVDYLSQKGFVWFELSEKANVAPLSPECSEFNGNFVAVPRESLQLIGHLQQEQHPATITQ